MDLHPSSQAARGKSNGPRQRHIELSVECPGLAKHAHCPPRSGCIVLLALLVTLVVPGCATIANGRHQSVFIASEPPGAEILLNGQVVGATPMSVRIRRRGPAEIDLHKTGYKPSTVSIPKAVSRWLAGNLIFLNPLAAQGMDSVSQWLLSAIAWFGGSLSLDFISGGAFTRPPVVTVTLSPLTGATPTSQRCPKPATISGLAKQSPCSSQ
jgi:hypothetical protein